VAPSGWLRAACAAASVPCATGRPVFHTFVQKVEQTAAMLTCVAALPACQWFDRGGEEASLATLMRVTPKAPPGTCIHRAAGAELAEGVEVCVSSRKAAPKRHGTKPGSSHSGDVEQDGLDLPL
jgi:hypothetical protein